MMRLRRKLTDAESAIVNMLADAIQTYDMPTDERGRDWPDARHLALYLADHLTDHAAEAEVMGECCPVCDVLREREVAV